jgi:hypothetical protein
MPCIRQQGTHIHPEGQMWSLWSGSLDTWRALRTRDCTSSPTLLIKLIVMWMQTLMVCLVLRMGKRRVRQIANRVRKKIVLRSPCALSFEDANPNYTLNHGGWVHRTVTVDARPNSHSGYFEGYQALRDYGGRIHSEVYHSLQSLQGSGRWGGHHSLSLV